MDEINASGAEYRGGASLQTANGYPALSEESPREGTSTLSWKLLFAIASLTLFVRVAFMVIFETWNFGREWAFGYEMGRMGQWLAEGKGFTLNGSAPTAAFPPLYPLFVGGIFYLFGVYTKTAAVSLFLFQSACSAAIAICLANVGNRLFGRATGIVAGLAWALYPTSVFYSVVRIWYSELAVLLVLLVVTIAITTQKPLTLSLAVLLGALSGLTVLTDSTMTLFLPLLFLWMLFAWRARFSKLVGLAALWVITAGVVVSPWVVRNWLVLGSPVLLKSNFGGQLLVQNSSRTSKTEAYQEVAELYKKGVVTSEVDVSRYFRNKALGWIRENPSEFVSATARRIFQFWVVNPEQGRESWLHMVFFSPLIVLALYGFRYASHRRWQLAPVWLFLLIYPLPYYVIHVDHGRYSYPVEPFVLLLAVSSAVAVWLTHRSNAATLYRARANAQTGAVEVGGDA